MKTTQCEHIAVIGAGSIGVAWAIVFARAGKHVALYEPDPSRRGAAPGEISSRLNELRRFELLGEPPKELLARIDVLDDLGATVRDAVYVQECIPEDLETKRELFARLDATAADEAVLASSSSMIPPSRFASDLAGRGRCLVAHPGNPPYLLPVVELVPAPFTDPGAIERAAALLSEARMEVVRVHGEPEGFVFNRLQGAVLREAYCLVRDGVVDVEGLDRVMRYGLGRRWAFVGPFETADLNTRGGIETHAGRMGPGYERMGLERGQHDPWTPELVRQVTEQRRRLLPLERWDERVAWRDRMLMALERCRSDAGETDAG